jgi:murein DD-endopeptidase MepM/ murein hydrolase activator NlpD
VSRLAAFLALAASCLLLSLLLAAPPALAGQLAAGYPTAAAAIDAAVRSYVEEIDPAHQLQLGELHQEGAWAYRIAQPVDAQSGELQHEVIPFLARLTADGWQAMAPGLAPAAEFNAWLSELPLSLMDESLKGYLQLYDTSRTPVAYFSGHFLPWPGGRWGKVTQRDGVGHYGQIDFYLEGDIYSSKPGRVAFIKESSPDPDEPCSNFEACWRKANVVVIQHGPQEYSWYLHLAYNSVPDNIYVGLDIPAGVKIGVQGRTGYTWGTTGFHLHFMVSSGHYPWSDPNNPDALMWATGVERTDFIEKRWDELLPSYSFLSQNWGSTIPQRNSVDGVVRDSAGRLAGGATVALLPGSGLGPARLSVTDGLGTYKFQQVLEGDYVAGAGYGGYWQMATLPGAGAASLDVPALELSRTCSATGLTPLESQVAALVCAASTAAPFAESHAPAATAPAAPLVLTAYAGIDNSFLQWQPTNSVEVTQYRVLRALGDSTTYAALGLTTQIFYVDSSAVPAGTRACYRVQAQRANGTIVATSNTACTTGQTLSLWVPHIEGRQLDTVSVPVNVRNANGLRLNASTIALDYDPRLLALRSVSTGVLASGYDWYTSTSVNGDVAQVRVNSISTQPPLLYGSGALFWLTFDVLASEVISSPLNLREYVSGGGGSTIYTPANPTQPVALQLLDGVFYMEPQQPYRRGDVDGDGAVTAADGAMAARVASNMAQATARQLRAAEVSGDGRVDAADGAAILRYAAQGAWPSAAAPAAAPAVVRIDNATGIQSGLVETTLRISSAGAWAGGGVWLAYDPARIAGVIAAEPAGIAAGQQVAFDDAGVGLARIVLSSNAPLASSGAFASVTLRVAPNVPSGSSTPLLLAAAALNDSSGRDYATSVLQTTVAPTGGLLEINYLSAYLPAIQR